MEEGDEEDEKKNEKFCWRGRISTRQKKKIRQAEFVGVVEMKASH